MYQTHTTMVTPNSFYGWELLFSMIRRSLTKRADMIVAFTHYLITKQFSVGAVLYDSLPGHARRLTERLPEHWNRSSVEYILHYMHDTKQFQLRAKIQDKDLSMQMEDMQTLKTASIVIQPDKFVARMSGTLFEAMPAAQNLMERLNNNLLFPILAEPDLTMTPISISEISHASNPVVHFAQQNIESSNPFLSTVPRFQSFPSNTSSEYQHYNSTIGGKSNILKERKRQTTK